MRYLLFPLLILSCLRSSAQLPEFHAQVFGAEQGLEAGYIITVFQDSQEFLWVGSSETMQRFDGRNVYKFRFPGNIAQAFCDREDKVWVLSALKIWRSYSDQWGFEEMDFDTSRYGQPKAIFQLRNRPVCAITPRGFFFWDEGSASFQALDTPLPPAPVTVGGVRFDTFGTTIFYPEKDRYIAGNLETGEFRSIPIQVSVSSFCALSPDLAILTYYDRYSVMLNFQDGSIRTMKAREYGLSAETDRLDLMDAEPLGDSLYMVTTGFGACTYDLRTDQFIHHKIYSEGKPIGLEEALVRIFRGTNNTWWAHNASNVLAFRSIRHSLGLLRNFHDDPNRSWSNRVVGFAEDDSGNVWFGGFHGFNRLNRVTGQIETHPPEDGATDRLSHISVRGLKWDGSHLLLGPTLKGIWIYEPDTDHFSRPTYAGESVREAIENEFINGFFLCRNKDVLVCGRHNGYLLEHGTYRLDFQEFPGSTQNITAVCQDEQERIWVGTADGLTVLNSAYEVLFTLSPPARGRIFSLYAISSSEILVGTTIGLFRLNPADASGSWEKIESAVDGYSVLQIHRDNHGRFWLGTSDGIFLLGPDFKAYRQFDYAENIQGELYHLFAQLYTSDSLLFMGGRNGINYFYPDEIELEVPTLFVGLQSLQIGDGDSTVWSPSGLLEFGPRQNTLTLEIVAPYYNNAAKLQYRYRLLEDGPWISNGPSHMIRLNDLSPGTYQVTVGASIQGSNWHQSPPITIRISPYFWQQPAFILIAGLVFILLSYFLIRRRDRNIRNRQQQSLELQQLRNTALQYELEMEQVLNYFNRSIARTNSVEEALWDVTQQCIARLGLEDCVIYLVDAERQVLMQKAAWGQKSSPDQKIVDPLEIPVGKGIVGSVAKTGNPELVEDTGMDARYIADDAHRGSELAVPILDGEKVVGVIDTEHSQKNYYTSWHLQLFTAIASLVSSKIALARSEESRRQALLEKVNSQRKAAEAKLQSLRLQMNPHFLFNALNSIQELILTDKTDGAALYLSKFSQLLRMVLTYSDRDFLSLREEIEILQLYVELESLRFYETFEFSLKCEVGLDTEEYKVPTLLIQPFVENAIWHGLLHKEGKRCLKVYFEADANDRLICTVEDNGIGRAAAGESRTSNWHTGKGMSGSAERLQTLNKQYNRQNELEIEDLMAEDGTPAGTRVRITIS